MITMAVELKCYLCTTPLTTERETSGIILTCVVLDNNLCPKSEHKLVFEVNCIVESDR